MDPFGFSTNLITHRRHTEEEFFKVKFTVNIPKKIAFLIVGNQLYFLSISLQYGLLDPSGSRSEILLRPNSWTKSRKSLKSFPSCNSQSPLKLCLKIYFSSNSFNLLLTYFFSLVTVHCREKGGKPVRKPDPLFFVLKNPYRILKSENSQDYGQ